MSSVKEYGCTSQAQRARTKLIKEVQENFKIDAFIGDVGDWEKVCVRNLVGMPVVVVPTGFKKISDAPSDDTRRKTTITTGIYAPPDHDHVALALAMAYQSVTKHHKQRPPIDDIVQTTLFQTRPQPLYLQDNYVVIDLCIWFNINVLK